jgi:hypothetical protein
MAWCLVKYRDNFTFTFYLVIEVNLSVKFGMALSQFNAFHIITCFHFNTVLLTAPQSEVLQ